MKNSFYSLEKIYKNNNKLVCVGFDDLFIRKTSSLIKDCKKCW